MEVKPKNPGPVYALSWINTVTTIFERLDKDSNGITPDEIKANFPKDSDAAEIQKWLDVFDINKDKKITLAEFWRTFVDKEREYNYPNSYNAKV
ncbi:hypothetical protein BDV24DRAFT_121864 [Aspergillus arachidicola]|uniref:EF-hand domain-containing protein n=1 Tax=Aspergillus arachidicola TaxID=656916 RepID=A0A5N6YUH0_9EURO|nr:hypothetical protein BDV24DRAFT_121864 [Aspergillus arachidicola]